MRHLLKPRIEAVLALPTVDVEAVKAALQEVKPENYCILIKGSNSMKLASLVPYL